MMKTVIGKDNNNNNNLIFIVRLSDAAIVFTQDNVPLK